MQLKDFNRIEFDYGFLERFPLNLQLELRQFGSFADGLHQKVSAAPELIWPPPNRLEDAFNFFVEIVWQVNASKGLDYCRGIVRSLNDTNFLCFAVTLRAFFLNRSF